MTEREERETELCEEKRERSRNGAKAKSEDACGTAKEEEGEKKTNAERS